MNLLQSVQNIVFIFVLGRLFRSFIRFSNYSVLLPASQELPDEEEMISNNEEQQTCVHEAPNTDF